jgi:outer membrane lipoprotein-sorting protein
MYDLHRIAIASYQGPHVMRIIIVILLASLFTSGCTQAQSTSDQKTALARADDEPSI